MPESNVGSEAVIMVFKAEYDALRAHDKEATDLTIDQAVEIGQLHAHIEKYHTGLDRWRARAHQAEAEVEKCRGVLGDLVTSTDTMIGAQAAMIEAHENARGAYRADNERLRAALAEMLESFTEPEDDNDILRRARAALGRENCLLELPS